MKKIAALIAIAGLATAVSAQASAPTWLYGNKIPDTSADRVVQINPSTNNVNVTWGHSVEFQDHGKTFAYMFDGPRTASRLNLQNVAPPGMINHPVYAYVGGSPENH